MPFDERDFPGAPPEDVAAGRRNRLLVAGWLFGVCAMVLVMFGLGAATRLTGSGLSIMEWAPLGGVIPPLSDTEWYRLFTLYQSIPQYQLLHPGMDLASFREIFWLEWIHRLWGRLIGLMFAGPLLWFWFQRRLPRGLGPRLVGILVLGACVAAVGWFMVASGFLPESTAVAPYRLMLHLGLALGLYAALFWSALTVWTPRSENDPAARTLRVLAWICVALILLTALAGALVAGTGAGRDYNSFPLMDGHLVPPGYARLQPWLRNIGENIATIQFHHRLLATLTLCAALSGFIFAHRLRPDSHARLRFGLLTVAVGTQYMLGVATLLLVVPLDFAIAHQLFAVVTLSTALAAAHAVRATPRQAGRRQ